MKAIILAADAPPPGQVESETEPRPFSLIPIRGEPPLLRMLSWLKRYDITDVALHIQDDPEALRQQIGDGADQGLRVVYAVETQPRGTAGILRELEAFLDDTFVIVYSHLLVDVDLRDLDEYHGSRNALVTLALKHTGTPSMEGMVECASDGRVRRFVERPATWQSEQRTATTRLSLAEPDVLRHIPDDRPFDWEEHLLPLLIAAGEAVYGQLADGQVTDLRTPPV